uniref:DOT1 domain-containing protein n=2 Tax=Lotharella globosa TaxID=91324 RepID=A0A7S3ZAV1_9EUKA|mmetsp:Transcript_15619/g.31653  ORF Transcript_15619/g.31653 Transcript_15619/m.31653 type:complete len:215 (-) Transcript_15619:78-722(-)
MNREKVLFKESGGSGTYGILEDDGVKAILLRADKMIGLKNKLFCDVGSGDGEAIISALLQFPMLKGCLGIELSPFRHKRAQEAVKNEMIEELHCRIELRCQDGLKADLSSCDVIYVSNLLAEERFNVAFGKQCDQQLSEGTIVFAINPVPMTRGKLTKELTGEAECSWGTPVVHGYFMGARGADEGKESKKGQSKTKQGQALGSSSITEETKQT